MFSFINLSADGIIKVWDYSTSEPGKLLRTVHEHDGWVTSFLFLLVGKIDYLFLF